MPNPSQIVRPSPRERRRTNLVGVVSRPRQTRQADERRVTGEQGHPDPQGMEGVMSDQVNENVETTEDVEGHMRPKWHAIEDEPTAETDESDEVEGHMRPKWHAIEDEPTAESDEADKE